MAKIKKYISSGLWGFFRKQKDAIADSVGEEQLLKDILHKNIFTAQITVTNSGADAGIYYLGGIDADVQNDNPDITISVNGSQSISQFQSEIAKNPISIQEIVIDTTERNALNTALSRRQYNATGTQDIVSINLLQKLTADNSNTVNLVKLSGEDLVNPLLDGVNFIQHTIPANTTINFIVTYKQVVLSDVIKGGKQVPLLEDNGPAQHVPLPSISEIDRKGNELISFTINNTGSSDTTYRLGGLNTGLPEVDNNDPLNIDVNQISDIPVPAKPSRYVIDGNISYVCIRQTGATDYISVVDMSQAIELYRIPIDPLPDFIIKVGNYLYISTASNNNVVVVDIAAQSQIQSITFDFGITFPQALIYSNNYIFVSIRDTAGQKQIAVIDPSINSVVTYLGFDATGFDYTDSLVMMEYNGMIYCFLGGGAGPTNAAVMVINPYTLSYVTRTSLSATLPGNMILVNRSASLGGGVFLYCTLLDGGVDVYDIVSGSVVANITVGTTPYGLVQVGDYIYVPCLDSNEVYKISLATHSVESSISVSGGPVWLTYINNYLYCGCYYDNQVRVIDLNTFSQVDQFVTGQSPFYIYAYDQYTYIHNSQDSTISVLSTDSQTPVITSLNNGQTVAQFNNDISNNPIKIKYLIVDVSNRSVLNNPISKMEQTGTGLVESGKANLLQHFTAFNSRNVNLVKLKGKDFGNAILDGSKFIEQVIPAGTSITLSLFYKQLVISDIVRDKDGHLIVKEVKKKLKKKYSHSSFKFNQLK